MRAEHRVDAFIEGFRAAIDVRLDLSHLAADIAEVQGRIKEAFYANLFLMLAESDRREITAREIDERREEKMLMLGPVLERLHDELLSPLVARVFNIMARNGQLPEPPRGLDGRGLQVEFISILAQAQKSVATAGIEIRMWEAPRGLHYKRRVQVLPAHTHAAKTSANLFELPMKQSVS